MKGNKDRCEIADNKSHVQISGYKSQFTNMISNADCE